MKRSVKYISAAVMAAAVCFFAACGTSYNSTTFVLHKDGTAKQYIIEDAYEDTGIGELQDYVVASVEEYQGGSEDTLIKIDKCDIADGKVNIELSYASCADYAAYNNVTCFDGTLEEASAAGFELNREYIDSQGNTTSMPVISSMEEEIRVLVMNEVTAVALPGKLIAYSTNVQMNDNGTLSTIPDTDESIPEQFRTTNFENAYFIYSL